MNKFRINEEVLVYDMIGKLHKGIIQRLIYNDYGFIKSYQVFLVDIKFIVEVDNERLLKIGGNYQ